MFGAGGKGGGRREGEDERVDLGGGGEEGLEKREVFWGDDDGDGEGEAGDEMSGEVEEREEMSLCWKGEDEEVGRWPAVGGCGIC